MRFSSRSALKFMEEEEFVVTESGHYSGQDIQVLEGLEAVRKRPGMLVQQVQEVYIILFTRL